MDMPENTKAVDTWLLVALVKVLMVDALTKHVLDVAMVAVVTLAVLMEDETVVAEDLVDAILAVVVAVVVLLVAVVVAVEAVLMLVVAVPTLLMATMLISWMLLAIRAIRRIKLEINKGINKTWVKLVSRMIHPCVSTATLATLRVQMIMVITESFRVRVEVLLVLALVKMVVLPGVMKHQGTLPGRHTQATNPAM